MTDLQDEICDRLVGVAISRNWVGGPLHAAALVLDPAFEPAMRGDTRPGQFARAVGWPTVFCEAFTGANSALPAENDRRALAVTLFAKVALPHPGKAARTPAADARAAAAWAAVRVHPLACAADCPLLLVAAAAVADRAALTTPAWRAAEDHPCPAAGGGSLTASVGVNGPAGHHAAVALRHLLMAVANPDNKHTREDAVREAAKVETKVRGVDGAADFCLTLAVRLGMRPG